MAVPPNAMPPPEQHRQQEEQQVEEEDDDFTFPTPPPPLFGAGARDKDRHHLPSCSPSPSSSPPVWLHLSYSPIRRSFSAADCAASPLASLRRFRCGGCSPALSDYAGFCDGEEEEEERMDSLWEDLNDEDDPFFCVSRRRSVGGVDAAARAGKAGSKEVLGASRSSRRRAPGLVVMMRALKKMFVAHKGKSRVHKDEQSTTPTASASPSPSLCKKK